MDGVAYISDSKNRKISGKGKADATYVSIQSSCPSSCELKGKGCYSELSFVGMHVRKLDKEAEGSSTLEVARAEAKALDNSYKGGPVPKGRDLRLHVSGDSRTVKGTRLINSAVGRWKKRGGNIVWSYSHSWRNIKRTEWSNVEILASVANIEESLKARKQGYAPAIVVESFVSDRAFKLEGSETKWIPCPSQTKEDVSCVSCRLCFNTKRLFDNNYGIAFAAHSLRKSQIKRSLKVIQ